MSRDENEGPLLYDDGPEPLHTGTARRRNGFLVAILGGTAALAVAAVVALPLVKGTPEHQAEQAAGVFLAALHKGDTETAYGLLCDAERARLTPGRMAPVYLRSGTPHVVGSKAAQVDGKQVERVTVRWSADGETRLTVVNEAGPHVCGTSG